MERIQVEFPDAVVFTTQIDIHGIYINRGNHVGNSAYVELCNETAQRFFIARGVPEYTVGSQTLLNVGYAMQVVSEAKYGDSLRAELAVSNFHDKGCDFFYRFSQGDSGTPVALARFSYLSFNYQAGRVEAADEGFEAFFARGAGE